MTVYFAHRVKDLHFKVALGSLCHENIPSVTQKYPTKICSAISIET
jgi:hypothetical protein